MPVFPKKETDVAVLADLMVAGFTAYPADFPSIDPLVELPALQAALAAYKADKQTQEDAKGQAQIATTTKETKLEELVEVMKNDLKLSEVDTTANPGRLVEIGWGPRVDPQPLVAPGQPNNLRSIAEGQGILWLEWDKPLVGGPVRNYILQRRQQPEGGGEFSEWALVTTTYNADAHLIDQPRVVQMEYRVKASNAAGESAPSNIASVVL